MELLSFIINLGASSTKLGLLKNEEQIWNTTFRHSCAELKILKNIQEKNNIKIKKIIKVLDEAKINLKEISAISAIGGLLKPLKGGTYKINEK